MEVTLVSHTPNPLQAIEFAACNCYASEPRGGQIAQQCYESGHLSVFEFAQFHFHIEGISRACANQIVRHRTGKYAQRSQRYCVEFITPYVVPQSIKDNDQTYAEYKSLQQEITQFYLDAIRRGVPPEDARYILSNATHTVIDVSFDLRNLIHFFNERLCAHAQWEIRGVAQAMRDKVLAVCPELKKYLVPKCEAHPVAYCPEKKKCGKHKGLAEMILEKEKKDGDDDTK